MNFRILAILMGLLALATGARANPTVYVQPINVCDNNGQNCALSNPYASVGYDPQAVQAIYANYGITVDFLTPVNYDNSTYLNPGVVDDPANGYITGSPTDPAHQLFDLPGHDQSTNPNVINLFLVNTLPHSSTAATQPGLLFGLSLLNGNGIVATTGVQYNSVGGFIAPIDNVAHEIGHSLGLLHVDESPLSSLYVQAGTAVTQPVPLATAQALWPNNYVPVNSINDLMNGSTRNLPRSLCGVYGTICDANSNVLPPGTPLQPGDTVGAKDQLLPFQAQDAQTQAGNLFTVNLAQSSASFFPTASTCGVSSTSCTFEIGLPNGSTGQTLSTIRIRFNQLMGDAGFSPIDELLQSQSTVEGINSILGTVGPNGTFGSNGCSVTQGATALGAGGYELDVNLTSACSTLLGKLTVQAGGVGEDVPPTDDFTPFSFEFDYSDGTTSLAAFDQSGNGVFSASPLSPITLGNSNIAAQYPNGPPIFVPTDPTLFNLRSEAEGVGTAMQVPEPSALALLGTFGIASLAFRRRLR